MLKINYSIVMLSLAFIISSKAQVSFSANSTVSGYNGIFNYGVNPGYYPAFSDKQNAIIAYNAGVRSSRPALYDSFLEQWGINIRKKEFKFYIDTLGFRDLTLFLSDPSDAHRDQTKFSVCNDQSKLFKNMYLPIWDSNNGTPINEDNYFAAYLYKVVQNYGHGIKFYEIWNEPDFTYNTSAASAKSGVSGSWWDSNPTACDLTNLKAPIYQYVRLLRIAYDVVKTLQPDAYVTTGGIGYPSFLAAILRNTDNPTDGTVTSNYPLKGGAYFDVLSYHSYPQYVTRYWSNAINGFVYTRHSDSAADSVFSLKKKLKKVLEDAGYNGTTFPSKNFIITETNIPRRQYASQDHIGSAEAQRNFIVKTMIKAQKEGIKQVYSYTLGDGKDSASSVADGYDLMGLYKNLNVSKPGNVTLSGTGIAHKSLSSILYGYVYNEGLTAALGLSIKDIDGAAFSKSGVKDIFALWAKTKTDQSESATASYTFPALFSVTGFIVKDWKYAQTNYSNTITGAKVNLSGSPVYITVDANLSNFSIPSAIHSENKNTIAIVYPNPFNNEISLRFLVKSAKIKVIVADILGTILYEQLYDTNEKTEPLRLNTTSWTPGIYLIKVSSGTAQTIFNVLKE